MTILTAVAAITCCGCNEGGRSAIEIPHVDPSTAASIAQTVRPGRERIAEQCGTGQLSCNARAALRHEQGRTRIPADEIAARLTARFSGGVGLTQVSCRVTVGGRPLDGATVRFVPERFLQSAVKPAVGTTDRQGAAIIAIADDELPGRPANVACHAARHLPGRDQASRRRQPRQAVGLRGRSGNARRHRVGCSIFSVRPLAVATPSVPLTPCVPALTMVILLPHAGLFSRPACDRSAWNG